MADDENNKPSAKAAWDGSKGKSESENPNQNPAAEKDGTGRTFEPKEASKLRPGSFSPTGTVPVKQIKETDITVTVQTETNASKPVVLDRNDITLEESRFGLTSLIRIEDEVSDAGIDGGRISRLTVTEGKIGDETILAHFESGEWEKEPDTFVARQAVMDAKREHNGLDQDDGKNVIDRGDDGRRRDRPDGSDMEL